MVAILSFIVSQFQSSGKYIPFTTCTDNLLALLALIAQRALVPLVIFENFLVFHFSFSQFKTVIASSFFLKMIIKVLLDFWCRNLQVMLESIQYCNHRSLIILYKESKYILPIFSTSASYIGYPFNLNFTSLKMLKSIFNIFSTPSR